MVSFFEITNHHDIAGLNTVFSLTFCIAFLYLLTYIAGWLRTGTWHDASRMVTGFVIMCAGVATRTGFWVPWRSYLANGDTMGADAYFQYAWMWTWGGTALSVIGLFIITFPAMRRKFGSMALPMAFIGPIAFYVFGVIAAEYLAQMISR